MGATKAAKTRNSSRKRPRASDETAWVVEDMEPTECTPSLVLPNCPPELAQLDTRITKVLLERPHILQFLLKHPSVMHNLNAEGIAFLVRNLRNANDTQEEASLSDARTKQCSVTISKLDLEATEADVAELFHKAGWLDSPEVLLPRESRRQRSCGVAYVMLPSQKAAFDIVRELRGAK